MSIMSSLFGTGSDPAPAPVAGVPDPNAGVVSPVAIGTPDPVAPVVPGVVVPNTPEPTGLDKWGNLVDNKTSTEGEPPAPTPVFDPVAILKDPAALEKISSQLDFSSSITKETQQLFADNDPSAMVAMANDIGKAAYLQALQHSSALAQQHVADRFDQQDKSLSSNIKTHLSEYELEQHIPEIKNPIVRMGTEQFVAKLKQQNPTMSASDVSSEVRSYLKELSATFNPDTPKPGEPVAPEEIDWLTEMGFK